VEALLSEPFSLTLILAHPEDNPEDNPEDSQFVHQVDSSCFTPKTSGRAKNNCPEDCPVVCFRHKAAD
jgi:hypothetical protein